MKKIFFIMVAIFFGFVAFGSGGNAVGFYLGGMALGWLIS